MYYVYVLQSLKDKKRYIGFTNNIKVRLSSHNNGLVKSTKFRRPLTIVYRKSFNTKKQAQLREIELKKMKGGIQFKSLLISRE
jgi:putative endonuclease